MFKAGLVAEQPGITAGFHGRLRGIAESFHVDP
jgi:hypothetical protein